MTGPIEYAIDGNELTRPGASTSGRPQQRAAQGRVRAREAARAAERHAADVQAGAESRRLEQRRQSEQQPGPIPLLGDRRRRTRSPIRCRATCAQSCKCRPTERTPEQDRARVQLLAHHRARMAGRKSPHRSAVAKPSARHDAARAAGTRHDPRPTHRLDRGNFLAPAEEVSPGVPAFLHPLQPQSSIAEPHPTSRDCARPLDFARWLADRRSPTTARSIVNRIWQAYFGTGLVATAEDLGTQGEPPSHPELLDWLAVELMDNDWEPQAYPPVDRDLGDVPAVEHRDAGAAGARSGEPAAGPRAAVSRRCGGGPRHRARGQRAVEPEVGGPSVYPPAPEFLFQPPASYGPKTWIVDTGPDRYRRALYTFRFRSVPYPVLQNFDAPNGEFACARRARSNTPLQALTTLNEPLFVECARALCARGCDRRRANGSGADDRAWCGAVCRATRRANEIEVLQEFLDRTKTPLQREWTDPWPLLTADDCGQREVASTVKQQARASRPGRLDRTGTRGVEFGRNDYEGVSRR